MHVRSRPRLLFASARPTPVASRMILIASIFLPPLRASIASLERVKEALGSRRGLLEFRAGSRLAAFVRLDPVLGSLRPRPVLLRNRLMASILLPAFSASSTSGGRMSLIIEGF